MALIAVIVYGAGATASAEVITFEEVPRHPSNFEVRVDRLGPLAFRSLLCDPRCAWGGISVMDVSALYGHIDLSAVGPMGALVSDGDHFFLTDGGAFEFESAYFGQTNMTGGFAMTVHGFANGVEVFTKSFVPQAQGAGSVEFGWAGVDRVEFEMLYGGSGYLAVDNIAIAVGEVPAPGTAILSLAGLLLLGSVSQLQRPGRGTADGRKMHTNSKPGRLATSALRQRTS